VTPEIAVDSVDTSAETELIPTLHRQSAQSAQVSQAMPSGTTVVHRVTATADEEALTNRRNTATLRPKDIARAVGSALSAIGLTWLIFTQLLPATGAVAWIVVAFVLYLIFFALVTSIDSPATLVRDKLASVLFHSVAIILLGALAVIIGFTLYKGWEALPHPNFFKNDMSNAGPLDPLTRGGIYHAIVGTLIMITIALIVTIPMGILCAVYLVEFPGRFGRFVQTIVEAMTALPSIIAGLFIYATLILTFGLPKSGFAASMAISVMMLPIIIRASIVVLRLVPGTLKEASYALGASHWKTVWTVVLPTARSGLATAVILGTARGIGETSPVLLTAGFTAALNWNPFSGPMVSLPLETFTLVKSPMPNFIARGFGTAAVLLGLVLILFIIARTIGGRGPGHQSKRAARRAAAQSRQDAARIAKQDASAKAGNLANTNGASS
jgi:phosphate transport system permease protein